MVSLHVVEVPPAPDLDQTTDELATAGRLPHQRATRSADILPAPIVLPSLLAPRTDRHGEPRPLRDGLMVDGVPTLGIREPLDTDIQPNAGAVVPPADVQPIGKRLFRALSHC